MDRDAKETLPKKENKHQLIRLIASNLPSQDIKARVEEGQGVPFFDERFNCREVLKVRPSPFEAFSFSSFSSSLSLIDFNRIHFFSGETWILYDYTHVLLSALPCLIKHPFVCFVPGWRCMVCISRTGPSHQEIESVSSSGDARLSSFLSSVELG